MHETLTKYSFMLQNKTWPKLLTVLGKAILTGKSKPSLLKSEENLAGKCQKQRTKDDVHWATLLLCDTE